MPPGSDMNLVSLFGGISGIEGVHGAAKTLEPWERMATRGRHPAIPAPGGLGGYGFHPKEYYDAAENYVNEAREAQNKPPANSFVI